MRARTVTYRLTPCLILAAAALLLDGRSATASCGDYVHVRTPGQQTTDPHPSPPADSPCAHGHCDRLPISPPAPEPTAPTGGSGPHDAVLASTDLPPMSAPLGFSADQAGVPSQVPSVPFHPPRV